MNLIRRLGRNRIQLFCEFVVEQFFVRFGCCVIVAQPRDDLLPRGLQRGLQLGDLRFQLLHSRVIRSEGRAQLRALPFEIDEFGFVFPKRGIVEYLDIEAVLWVIQGADGIDHPLYYVHLVIRRDLDRYPREILVPLSGNSRMLPVLVKQQHHQISMNTIE